MNRLEQTVAAIKAPDTVLDGCMQQHLDALTKPPGSLGRLEELALRFARIRGRVPPDFGAKRICCFAGDHGVADEGVSAFPRAVTTQMVLNMVSGGAAVNVLSRHVGADLRIIDIGVDAEIPAGDSLLIRKVARGTANMARGPAMSVEQARAAVEVGISIAAEAAEDGVCLLGTGEMGIANTTPASALMAVYLDASVECVTGRGSGIDSDGLAHKVDVIRRAIKINRSRLTSPLNILAALGGLEIAGICGLVLGGAAQRAALVVDGFISTAAALAALRLCPEVSEYLFFSHVSGEQGHRHCLRAMGARPILDLDMRLGEGTGAALAMSMIEASVKLTREMATFNSAGVSAQHARQPTA